MDRIRKQNDVVISDTREDVVKHFISSLFGVEKSDLDNPLTKSINDTYQQFQKDQVGHETAH